MWNIMRPIISKSSHNFDKDLAIFAKNYYYLLKNVLKSIYLHENDRVPLKASMMLFCIKIIFGKICKFFNPILLLLTVKLLLIALLFTHFPKNPYFHKFWYNWCQKCEVLNDINMMLCRVWPPYGPNIPKKVSLVSDKIDKRIGNGIKSRPKPGYQRSSIAGKNFTSIFHF